VRVISGSLRGRKLLPPQGFDVRPTTDKVKESAFNIIQFRVPGARVLDLFAGSGQLGIEAVSRGAELVTFVEKDDASLKVLLKNTGILPDGSFETVKSDALYFLKNLSASRQYDIIFADPPYDTDLLDRALAAIEKADALAPGGIIICESRRKKALPGLDGFSVREFFYGVIKLTVYKKNS
jgi:16S rRNA (guanine(966)-N(2))-methyltransferase RsmD